MNFNELQEAWKDEGGSEHRLSIPPAGVSKASQPIDAIRRNMKKEYYYQFVSIGFIFFFPNFFNITGNVLIVFYSMFGMLLMVSAYYFFRFYSFFKKMHHFETSARESLLELYYEIRLHIEMYKSFSFLLLPFVLIVLGTLGYDRYMKALTTEGGQGSMEQILIRIATTMVLVTLAVIVLTNWWTEHFYGKHANRLRQLLDEMKE
ncbi:MAG TPA: hypothetical protein VK907_08180 [Phnomibacter sp.]|nr:hypothetical protein [Phnomibacter sp.]